MAGVPWDVAGASVDVAGAAGMNVVAVLWDVAGGSFEHGSKIVLP